MAGHLTIRAIETIVIRVPLRQVYRGSFYHMTHRATILTRIHTDEGIVGEAFVGDEDHINDQIERVIREEITPRLAGADAMATELCWQLARPATFDILRDRRIGLVACAAVDTAIWDAVGKALGQPLWRLWGGYRNRIGVIWTGGYYGTDLSIAAEIAAAREAGVAGMKFKVGGRTPEEDAARFAEARKAAGAGFVLIADANRATRPMRLSALRDWSKTTTCTISKSPAAGTTTSAPCATCGIAPARVSAPGRANFRPAAAGT